jgi:hypothetical protein
MDQLSRAFSSDTDVELGVAFVRLVGSLLLGLAVAWIHARARVRSGRPADSALAGTLVLLTVLLCLTALVVGDNVARAFSIVGALSIVRFRTVVEDTRDTAFVVFAVAIGLAAGAGFFWLPLLALPVGAAASMCFVRSSHTLTIRAIAGFAEWSKVEAALKERTALFTCKGVGTRRGGIEQDRFYDIVVRSQADLPQLLDALHAVDGVLAIELDR